MKILALDLGDKWVGTAISDPLRITCKPLQTVEISQLTVFLAQILKNEIISIVVIGYPKTMSGGQSEQTLKIIKTKEALEQQFSLIDDKKIEWVLWDERLSSKRAGILQNNKSDNKSKKKSHSLAAAFILQCYLDYLALNKQS
jgi:putative Holliday junction resolvase